MRSKKTSALSLKAAPSVMRPKVFCYHDYRVFLIDWLAFRRASQSDFSLRALSKQADLTAGFLPLVLSGKRPLSGKAFAKLAPHLGLDPTERSYLEVLVTLGTTESQDARLDALERMKRFGQYQLENPKESTVYQYLTHWYYVVIREMASLPEFKLEAEWIQARLTTMVPIQEVKEALKFLLSNGYIEVLAGGTVRPPEKVIECDGGVYRVALTQFHREMFTLAAKSIENTPSEERSILGHTVAIKADNIEKAKAILREATERLCALGTDEKDPDSIYHLELALFPLTRRTSK